MGDRSQLARHIAHTLRHDPGSWFWVEHLNSTIGHTNGTWLFSYLGSAHVWQPEEVHFGLFDWLRVHMALCHWKRRNPRVRRPDRSVARALQRFGVKP